MSNDQHAIAELAGRSPTTVGRPLRRVEAR